MCASSLTSPSSSHSPPCLTQARPERAHVPLHRRAGGALPRLQVCAHHLHRLHTKGVGSTPRARLHGEDTHRVGGGLGWPHTQAPLPSPLPFLSAVRAASLCLQLPFLFLPPKLGCGLRPSPSRPPPQFPDTNLPTLLVYHAGSCVKHLVGMGAFGGQRTVSPEREWPVWRGLERLQLGAGAGFCAVPPLRPCPRHYFCRYLHGLGATAPSPCATTCSP